MDRRQFISSVVLTAGGSVVSNSALAGALKLSNRTIEAHAGKRRPNVIYIIADDLGYAELGCYGQKKIRTPNLDKLAAEGMRFTQHYSGQAVCAPARCSLMEGKHMGHAFIRDNYETGGYQLAIPDSTLTIAEIFKQEGYTTAAMGKWGLGGPNTSGQPNRQGFDHFYGYLGQVQAHWYYPDHLWSNEQQVLFPDNFWNYGKNYSHDEIAAQALKFISDNRDNPFFLYLPFTIPHVSLQVPQDSLDEYLELGWTETPWSGSGYPNDYTACSKPKATYAAMITRMDRDIGRIMNLLKELGIDDNTIVFFSGDNGTTYCCGVDYNFFESEGPLRGLKGSLYEGGIREPLIVRWPGKIRPGAVTDHLSAFWDILPTCCEIIGAKIPEGIDGISFLPVLTGKPQQQHDYLYWEFKSYGAQQAVRMGRWKGYRKDVRTNPNPPMELYDLETDISESNNIAASYPDIVAQIKRIMTEAHTYSSYFPLLYGE